MPPQEYARGRDGFGPIVPAKPGHALDIIPGGCDHRYATSALFDPDDRQVGDPGAHALDKYQQFGIKEPSLILHNRHDTLHGGPAQGLEATLRVTEPVAKNEFE